MQRLAKREATSCQTKTRLPSVEIPKEHNNRHTGIRKRGSQLMMRCSVSRADDDDDDDGRGLKKSLFQYIHIDKIFQF